MVIPISSKAQYADYQSFHYQLLLKCLSYFACGATTFISIVLCLQMIFIMISQLDLIRF